MVALATARRSLVSATADADAGLIDAVTDSSVVNMVYTVGVSADFTAGVSQELADALGDIGDYSIAYADAAAGAAVTFFEDQAATRNAFVVVENQAATDLSDSRSAAVEQYKTASTGLELDLIDGQCAAAVAEANDTAGSLSEYIEGEAAAKKEYTKALAEAQRDSVAGTENADGQADVENLRSKYDADAEAAWADPAWTGWEDYKNAAAAAAAQMAKAVEIADKTYKLAMASLHVGTMTAMVSGGFRVTFELAAATADQAYMLVGSQAQIDHEILVQNDIKTWYVNNTNLSYFEQFSAMSVGVLTWVSKAVNAVAGFLDGLTGGATRYIFQWTGVENSLNIDTDSGFYIGGRIVGCITLMVLSFVASSICPIGWGLALKVCIGAIDLFSAGEAGYRIYTGKGTWMDYVALLPIVTYGVGAMGKAMKFWGSSCFVAGTDVLASSGGETVCKKIEDVQVGDLVWTRPENDADAPLELRPVTAVYQNVAYELRRVTIEDSTGNTEEIGVTTEHPFYSVTRGWVRAADLVIGEEITSADGRVMHVTAHLVEAHPEGLVTYNFQVESGHTYFVADGLGEESWIWVHNDCTSKAARILGKNLEAAGHVSKPGEQAAHLLPTGSFKGHGKEVAKLVKEAQKKFDKPGAPRAT